jgi:hypothetical protein
MNGEERDRLIGNLVAHGGQLAAALLTDQQRLTAQQLIERGLAKWTPDFVALSLAWICPVCGPSLITSEGDRALFCVRHGDQSDIDEDPDLEDWRSRSRSSGVPL